MELVITGSFPLRAHGKGGASATILSFLSAPPPPEKITGGFQQAGKKEGGLGEGIFARLLSAEGGMGWESVSAIPASAGRQNRKIFVSLIEKNFGGRRLKKYRENFSVLLVEAKRRQTETLGGIYSKCASGFSLKKVRILFRRPSQYEFGQNEKFTLSEIEMKGILILKQ